MLFRSLRAPWLLWLAAVSYPLYLIHQHLGYVKIDALMQVGVSRWVAAGSAFVTMLLLAWLLTRLIEQPALSWFHERRLRLDNPR